MICLKKYCTLLFILLFFFSGVHGQSTASSWLEVTSTVPADLTVCSQAKTFTITLNNPTPFLLQSGTLTLVMPLGMNYQPGSITGATVQSVSTNTLVLILGDISPQTFDKQITYAAFADCNIISFLSVGNIAQNSVRVDYTKSGDPYHVEHTSASYNIRQPNLSITTTTNLAFVGTVGATFNRCITIVNGGLGELSTFTLTDVHGAGLQVTAVNNGSWSSNGLTETVVLNTSDFSSIGNGNSLFETGESIVICQTINITNCSAVQSDYKVFWGCNGSDCQFSTISGNVVFPGSTPDLTFTPNGGDTYANMNSCFGPSNASPQQLQITNNGTGTAVNVAVDIHQTTSPGWYNSVVGSYIDVTNITMQIDGGAPSNIVPISTQLTNPLNCMPNNPVGQFIVNIPSIAPGQTITLKWNSFSCLYDACAGIGQSYNNGWGYQGTYESICGDSFSELPHWGRVYSQLYANIQNNLSPSTLDAGETGSFNFILNDYGAHHNYPSGPNSQWNIEFTLSPCLTFNGNFNLIRADGTAITPNSITTVGNVVTATFLGGLPVGGSLLNAAILSDFNLNCAACGNASSGNVDIKFSYTPNNTCSGKAVLGCYSYPVSFNCPSPCPEGLIFKRFNAMRTNFGLPDNEAGGGNGIADAAGALDFTKIRTDRAMYGDTINTRFLGIVKTSAAFPSWQYCYASSTISNGSWFTFLDAQFTIYRAGVAIVTLTNIAAPTITGTQFKYDLSVTALGGVLPVGFNYLNDDSLVFVPRYVITTNNAWANTSCNISNEYYMTPIPAPILSTDKYQCGIRNSSISIIGYNYYNWATDVFPATSCNTVSLYQYYAAVLGTWFQPHGNLFPNEYRHWGGLNTITVTIPSGYQYQSANVSEYQRTGTFTSTINPMSTTGNVLVFDVGNLYQNNGGTIPLSDDGMYGTINVNLLPSCSVVQNVNSVVNYDMNFSVPSQIGTLGVYPMNTGEPNDFINYEGPQITMQADLLSVNAPNDTANWVITLNNNANQAANNVWIAAPTISGVSAQKLWDVDNNTLIAPIGGIYQLGTLAAQGNRRFRLVADFTSCLPDSIVAYSGWNCAGYPASLAAYPCTPLQIKLSVTPLLPNLVTTAVGPANSIALCDTATYVVTIKNVQLGTARNILLNAALPVGVAIVPGSSMLSYPSVNSFSTISNPNSVGGTIWNWDVSASNLTLTNDGIKGVLEPSLNTITIKFKAIASCGYTSGSAINFTTRAFSNCQSSTGGEVALSTNLSITGAIAPYTTLIKLDADFITPCRSSNTMKVVIQNQGPLSFQNADSVTMVLPVGVSYVPASFLGIHNAPVNTIPLQYVLNNQTYLVWKLPNNVAVGDSSAFNFNYLGDPTKLTCVTSPFKATSIIKQNLSCLTGSNCDIAVITGNKTINRFTYKSYLSFSNGSSSAIPSALGETVNINFNINNAGEEVQAGTPTTISYYDDTDGNGIYSAADTYLINDVIVSAIANNGVYSYSASINVPAGKACNLIAVLDTTINRCSCTPGQLLLRPRLINAGADKIICALSTSTIGLTATAGYTYSWTPSTGLSDPLVSNPTIVLTNSTAITQTVTYILTTTRLNCTTNDTMVLFVNPLPVVSATSSTICVGQQTATLTANGANTYIWNTGETTSTVTQTPIVTTNYTVIGTDANGCTNTATTTVLVNTLPIVSATSSTICVGQQTATLIANGATTYTWNTGETTPNTTQTPAITTDYSVTGTDANGCTNAAIATVLVNTLPTISVTSSTICLGQQTATLSANGAVTYTWNNGATTSSIAVTPNATTQYTVVGEDSNGCLNANVVDAKVNPTPTAAFVLSNACVNSLVTLNNTSTVGAPDNITNVVWQFASGANISTSNDPLLAGVTFSTIGAHTIALTVSSNNGCSSTITNTVTIFPKPTASFSASSVCQASVTAFTDLSSVSSGTIVGWEWDFTADNTMDNTNQHPTFLYSSSGTYTAALISTTDNGCKDTVFNIVNVWGNSITDFLADTVCYGTITTFTNTTDVTTNSNIGGSVTYSWEFGDGTVPSNQNNATHLYNSVPNSNTTYTVKLTGTTTHGCINEKLKNVYIYAIPEASFIADSVCLGASTTFTDMSISNGNTLTNYTWDFLNNGSVSTFSNNISQFTYTAIGQHIVSYTVTTKPMSSLACKNSTIQSIWINPNPSPNFTANNACVNVQPINFDATSSNIATGSNTLYAWDFGDGNTGFNAITTHTYNVPQTYSVMLTVTSNKGCKTSITKQVDVYPKPIVTINTSTTTCFGKGTPLNITTAINSGAVVSWNWDINNSLSSIELTGQAVSHTFSAAGSQTVNVITETNNGCKDTSSKVIYIDYLPVPLFSARNTKGCPELCTSFSDGTLPVVAPATNAIWEWDFGDGTFLASNSSNSPVHCYDDTYTNQVTNYSVKLTVTTDKGCKDSVAKLAFITLYPKPVAQFTANPNPVEVTNPLVEFTNQSTGFTKWAWNFDDGSDLDIINLNTSHVYQSLTAKDYSVTLIVSNNFQCTDTALVKVVVTPNYSFYIPNAFSPSDENDINDRFTGVGIGIAEYEMWIYDRWGELLYYTNDITKGWDGKKSEKGDVLKQDVYVWKVNIRDVLKERHGYVGHVTLIR